jgi:very-short-patch-repair endonuclease
LEINDIKIINYNGHKIRVFKFENNLWFIGKDICNILGLKNSRASMSGLDSKEYKFFTIKTSGGKQSTKCLNEKSVKELLIKSRKQEAINFGRKLGINITTPLFPNDEQQVLNIISSSFKHLEQKHQFQIGPYRIDLYFPEIKIAVEVDELNHDDYNAAAEVKREMFIINQLNCKIIRFNPDAVDFNVGDIINEILMKLRLI